MKSKAYTYFRRPTLKESDSEAEELTGQALKDVKAGAKYVCILCQAKNLPLRRCLFTMRVGDTSNATKHLNTSHKEEIEAIEKKEKEEDSKKRKSNVQALEDAKKSKKQTTLMNSISVSAGDKQKAASAELYRLQFKFFNNNGISTHAIHSPEFRNMIDFTIENARHLKNHQHMANRRYITIECATFNELVDTVKKLVDDIRSWYIDKTGARQKFITVAHDVWDGKNAFQERVFSRCTFHDQPLRQRTKAGRLEMQVIIAANDRAGTFESLGAEATVDDEKAEEMVRKTISLFGQDEDTAGKAGLSTNTHDLIDHDHDVSESEAADSDLESDNNTEE